MKKILYLVITIILFSTGQAFAIKATTVENGIACLSKESLQEMQQFSISKDQDNFTAYIQSGKCIIMKAGLDVTVIDPPGMFGGMTTFIFKGIKFWTFKHSLNNYRTE